MESRSIFLTFFFAVFFLFGPDYNNFSFGFVCKERERQALLSFIADLKYPDDSFFNEIRNTLFKKDLLSTWDGKECCNWTGVFCNRKTGNVVELHLQDSSLGGNLNPSLLELKHLYHLNLSGNDFIGIEIPSLLGSLHNLRYLDLHRAGFAGIVPQELGNLSNLHFLDISNNYQLDVSDLQWLSHLSSIQHLDMSYLNLSSVSHKWIHVINMLPSLVELRLSDCNLDSSTLPTLPHINFTSLSILDLSKNDINSSLPAWLYNFTKLEELDLSFNDFHGTILEGIGCLTSIKNPDLGINYLDGEIPNTMGNLCNLKSLDLSANKLSGPLPEQLGKLQNLEYLSLKFNSFSGSIPSSLGRLSLLRALWLQHNELNGSLPETIWHLSCLERLIVSDNNLKGVVTEVNLANLRRLQVLDIDSVDLKLSSAWNPPFQLKRLFCRYCHIGSRFPQWLKTQTKLTYIDLSNTRISGTVPTWFWGMSSQMDYLNLANNRLTGELPEFFNSSSDLRINLSSNHFNGPLPRVFNVGLLDLSHNSLSGPISSLRCHPKFSEMDKLYFLDLSNNALSGEILECWFHSLSSLSLLKLESNKLTGKIPSSIGSLVRLKSLHLGNNSLSGELPQSLRNCTKLITIDLGENKFSGSISTWLGADFGNLILLRLRLNKFSGGIPNALCNLTSLQILDIAHNNLSGSIPRCFSNLSAMALKQEPMDHFGISIWGSFPEHYPERYPETYARFYSVNSPETYPETASLVTKGIQYEYSNTLRLVTIMDLSTNNLTGEIPQELTTLHELRFLNLSENHFTGKIPDKIGKMGTLESLDLSSNKLSGVIPQSITDLHSLNHLNLSYNNLSGKIPSGTQLQTFTELSYVGNLELCGIPLKNCKHAQPPGYGEGKQDDDVEDDWLEMKWFYISAGLGFLTGFWGFCGVLLWKQSWRHAYFGFITSITQKFFKFCTWYFGNM